MNRKVLVRISCIALALLLLAGSAWFLPLLFSASAAPVGYSAAVEKARFIQALGDPNATAFYMQGDLDVSDVDWQIQRGSKTISGTSGTEKLILPATLQANGGLTFERVTLSRNSAGGTVIYANGFPFRFGGGVGVQDGCISAVYGGGFGRAVSQSSITLESGTVGTVYLGSKNGAVTGAAVANVFGTANVGAVYGSCEGSSFGAARHVTLTSFGSASEYRQAVPAVSGVDQIRLENTYLRFKQWPALSGGKVVVSGNSALWLDGSMSLTTPLQGENGALIVTGGHTIALPVPVQRPGFLSGSFRLSLSAGPNGEDNAVIVNGGAYKPCFAVGGSLYLGGSADLAVQQIYVEGISLAVLPKTSYLYEEALETVGGVVQVSYLPKSVDLMGDVALIPEMVSGYDSRRVGQQQLIVTYEGKTTSYMVWVAEPNVASLRLQTLPSRTTYYLGESLEISGGFVGITYRDGTQASVPFSDSRVTITGFDSVTTGTKTLSVTYNGQPAGVFMVTVKNISSSGGGSGSGGTNIPDGERDVSLKGLPKNNTVQVGDRFSLSAAPNRWGNWEWDDDFFSVKIAENTNVATFTALKTGRSRITYSDRYTDVTEVIQIQKGSTVDFGDDIEEPPLREESSAPAPVVTPPPAVVAPPASSSSTSSVSEAPEGDKLVSSEASEKEEESSSEPEEDQKEEPDPEEIKAPGTQEPSDEAPGAPSSRRTVAMAGIGAGISMLAVGGVCIWRVIRHQM